MKTSNVIVQDIPTIERRELRVVGSSVPRVDALEKVTGKALYGSDVNLPGMLYAKVVRSPHPHARVVSIDAGKAEQLAGVWCVITGKDVPDKRYGRVVFDQTILAKGIVRYAGEPVAAVCADSLDVAQEAAGLIKVEYEKLPSVFDVEQAVGSNPPVVVHPDLPKYEIVGAPGLASRLAELKQPNVFLHFKIRHGEIEKGFKDADLVIENRFETKRIQHVPLEPHGVVAQPEADGGLTLWVGRQSTWEFKGQIGMLFGIRPSKIRVIRPYVGGGFGGKVSIAGEAIAALLALRTGRPVKLVFTREEVFHSGGSREEMVVEIRDGIKRDGTLVAREIKALLNAGAYENLVARVTRACGFGSVGIYQVPNFKWDSYGVYSNEPPACALRGFGSTEVVWAIEQQMDIIAERLGIDPVALRKKNFLREGDVNAIGETVHSIGVEECLDKALGFVGQGGREDLGEDWVTALGFAVGNKYAIAPTSSMARVKITEDGVIEVYHSAEEIGQGCDTAMAQIAAEEFGVGVDGVRVISGDTLLCPFVAGGSTSSRITFQLGNAVKLACGKARTELFRRAAMRLHVAPDVLDTRDGDIYARAEPERKIRITQLFSGYRGDRPGAYGQYVEDGEIVGNATYVQECAPEDPETGQIDPVLARAGKRLVAFWAYTAKAVEVAVNTKTGQVKLLRIAAGEDMGRPINPKMCEQQSEGGMMMGLGAALYEEMLIDKGLVLNANLTDYRIPTSTCIPRLANIKSFPVYCPHKDGPYGAKGFSEGAMLATEPAICNAIYNAVGVRAKVLPVTPERLLAAIRNKTR